MIDTAIIYTRTNSKRFKNKALVKVYKNKSLIESVVQNTFKIKSIKKIIVATTKSKKDLIFEKILKKYKVKFFYGSTNDLIDRSLKCSSKFKFDYFIIICGDRPFFSYKYIDDTVTRLNKSPIRYDLITNNNINKTVDQGLTVEIISSSSLKRIKKKKLSKYNLENITSYFYKNPKNFNIYYLKSPKNWFLNHKYTIDKPEDLNKMRIIISRVGYNKFNLKKCVSIYKKLKDEN